MKKSRISYFFINLKHIFCVDEDGTISPFLTDAFRTEIRSMYGNGRSVYNFFYFFLFPLMLPSEKRCSFLSMEYSSLAA